MDSEKTMKNSIKLPAKEKLKESFNYLKMHELKALINHFALENKGKKGELIDRILHYLYTGKKLRSKKIPETSLAKPRTRYSLAANSLMLKGAYKNDLETRLFFKKLIGDHFHFTAYGIDWLNERWQKGKPPTYREFAEMWQKEYTKRQNKQVAPKEEWAYINFVQKFLNEFPNSSRTEIMEAWKNERIKHKNFVYKLCKEFE
jgi:hypothetical protein